jgi:hypothetical protein
MTTEIDIANRALSAAGTRSSIASFTEPSPEARQCRLLYASTRDAMLRGAHWNFTRATAQLTLLKAAPGTPENPNSTATQWNPSIPSPPWLYSYLWPSDCLLPRYLPFALEGNSAVQGLPVFSVPTPSPTQSIGGERARFIVTADTDLQGNACKAILTDQTQAICVYTKRIELPDLWDPLFEEAMVAALASRLIIPLSGDKALRRDQVQMALSALEQARRVDGNEGPIQINNVPDWIAIRGYARDWVIGGPGGYWGAWSTPAFLTI